MLIVPTVHAATTPTPFEHAVDQLELRVAAPTAVQRLLAVLDDPDASWRRVEEALSVDAGLVTRVLRLASSPAFAARSIGSLAAAIQVLGSDQLRRLVVAAHFAGARSPFSRALWTYSLRVAFVCDALAQVARVPRGPDPFLCGLLHDVGTAVLDQILGARYTGLGFAPGGDAQPAIERAALGFDHADLGAMVAQRWNLFPELELVAQLHHDPAAARALGLPAVTTSAIALVALARLVGRPDPTAILAVRDDLCAALDLAPDTAEACAAVGAAHATALVDSLG